MQTEDLKFSQPLEICIEITVLILFSHLKVKIPCILVDNTNKFGTSKKYGYALDQVESKR